MASQDYPKNFSVGDLDLECEICHSSEIKETEQGYVCADCGLVLEIQKMEYHHPYKEERIQHAVLDRTQIGNTRERYQNQFSRKFHKLNKINHTSSREDPIYMRAKVEISRLINGLEMSSNIKRSILEKYKNARDELASGTKFRNPDKLVPGVMYYHTKMNGQPLDESQLLDVSKLDKKDFNRLKLKIGEFMPEYYSRDRKEYISNRIMQIREEFELDMGFYHKAQAILEKLWEEIKCTKDDVVAGLVGSIVALCHYQDEVNVNSICKALHIQMSTIQSQVKRRIIDQFHVPGFQSLVRSADLLKKIMVKLGFFTKKDAGVSKFSKKDEEKKNGQNEDEKYLDSEIVYIELPKVMPDTHSSQPFDHSIFAVRDENSCDPTILTISLLYSLKQKPQKAQKQKIKFEISRYHYPKGPPILYC
ncbi:MAG: hypothetical protein ACQERB_12865 [Promethearchaeati archaeon]